MAKAWSMSRRTTPPSSGAELARAQARHSKKWREKALNGDVSRKFKPAPGGGDANTLLRAGEDDEGAK